MPSAADTMLVLLVQIALILALSRIMGALFAYLHQPQVMGEMIAGIMLGPSLLGTLAPQLSAALFPAWSIPHLNVLSQIGVIFFLFLVGLELDLDALRRTGRSAAIISQTSILLPFGLGIGLAVYLYQHTTLFGDPTPQMPLRSAALFMGAAMSITAFPVLARILTERNLHKTQVGAIAITCAAVDDASAWCILAFVVAAVQAKGPADAAQTAGLALAYVAAMFLLVRPAVRRLEMLHERQGRLSQTIVAVTFLLVLASAYVTEWIGIHALFGAFLMGVMMPKGTRFVRQLSEKLEDYTVVFLLPLFFASAGLKTQINLLNEPTQWLYTGLIVLVACVGKFGGAAGAARLCGIGWRQSSAIGILMNTRGLMELVILNIGLQLGVITERVFAMMVIMALVTTAMTSPLLYWVFPFRYFVADVTGPLRKRVAEVFTILIPISLPRSGRPLMQLADAIAGRTSPRRVVALYLRRPVDYEAYRSGVAEEETPPPRYEPLEPLLEAARQVDVPVETVSFISRSVADDIASVATQRQVNLVLMGFHKPVIGQSLLGGTVHRVLGEAPVDVAVFMDRGLQQVQRILIPYLGSRHDRFAMELAGRIARNAKAAITVLHVVPPSREEQPALGAKSEVDHVFNDPQQPVPVSLRILESDSPVDVVLREAKQHDLVVVGVGEEWGLASQLFGWRAERIARDCPTSLLVVRRHTGAPAEPTPEADAQMAANSPHSPMERYAEAARPKEPASTSPSSPGA